MAISRSKKSARRAPQRAIDIDLVPFVYATGSPAAAAGADLEEAAVVAAALHRLLPAHPENESAWRLAGRLEGLSQRLLL